MNGVLRSLGAGGGESEITEFDEFELIDLEDSSRYNMMS